MTLGKRGAMNENIEFYLGKILDSQEAARGENTELSKSVIRYAERQREMRGDVDGLIEAVGTDGKNGLIEEMRSFRNSLDMHLVTRVEKKPVNPQWVAQWVAIGAGVIAYIVEILLPLWRL